jgi:transposase-like protein
VTKKTLNVQIEQLLESLDNQDDVAAATKLPHKRFFEKSLNAEFDEHLGYQKHNPNANANFRNGSTSKRVYTDECVLEIDTPRDRKSSFEPQIIKKRQTRLPTLDSKIAYLYSQGLCSGILSTREIT